MGSLGSIVPLRVGLFFFLIIGKAPRETKAHPKHLKQGDSITGRVRKEGV